MNKVSTHNKHLRFASITSHLDRLLSECNVLRDLFCAEYFPDSYKPTITFKRGMYAHGVFGLFYIGKGTIVLYPDNIAAHLFYDCTLTDFNFEHMVMDTLAHELGHYAHVQYDYHDFWRMTDYGRELAAEEWANIISSDYKITRFLISHTHYAGGKSGQVYRY